MSTKPNPKEPQQETREWENRVATAVAVKLSFPGHTLLDNEDERDVLSARLRPSGL